MGQFQKGNKAGIGNKRGKARFTNDVRQVFHRVYDELGKDTEIQDKATGEMRPQTGHEAMLAWARDNQTEFYRLYGKMIPATAELGADLHEDFIADLVFAEEQGELVEATAVDVGNEGQLTLPSGETVADSAPPVSQSPKEDANAV